MSNYDVETFHAYRACDAVMLEEQILHLKGTMQYFRRLLKNDESLAARIIKDACEIYAPEEANVNE